MGKGIAITIIGLGILVYFLVGNQPDTWTDPQTNLMWKANNTSTTVPWYSGKKYCESLQLEGYTDWRLPTIDELRTIVYDCPSTEPRGACQASEFCNNDGCICGSCESKSRCNRNNNLSGLCTRAWSTTEMEWNSERVFYLDFNGGAVDVVEKAKASFLVQCVRKMN